MAAHRYWRILGYRNSGDATYTGWTEIEMRIVAGGASVCVGGTPSASVPIQAGTAASVFDGSGSTLIQWSTTSTTQWVSYDFGAGHEKDIVEIAAKPNADGTARTPSDFAIQYSDDNATWNSAWVVFNTAWTVNTFSVFTKPATASHALNWRIRGIALGAGFTMSCAELKMRATVGGADQCVGGTPSARSFFSASFAPAKAFDNNPATFWSGDSDADQASWLAYAFPAAVAVAQISWTARPDGSTGQNPLSALAEYSQDGVNWLLFSNFSAGAWTAGQTQNITLTSENEIHTPQAAAMSIIRVAAQALRAPQAESIVAYGIPAFQMNATYAGAGVAYKQVAVQFRVEQATAMVVHRGRIANPRVRAWTFTLDGHDFYVLRLGDSTTLLYDVYSEQWIEWGDGDTPVWRPNCGMSWNGGQALGNRFGSSVVVGDDTFGLLWFLDPNQAFDDHPDPLNIVQHVPFTRIVTSQTLASGRDYSPCYAVFVDGDNYGEVDTQFTPTITLEYSDDQGRSFVAAETLGIETDPTVNNPYAWYSLGQINSPGRIFRVTDNGVFTRIDSMEMNDNAG